MFSFSKIKTKPRVSMFDIWNFRRKKQGCNAMIGIYQKRKYKMIKRIFNTHPNNNAYLRHCFQLVKWFAKYPKFHRINIQPRFLDKNNKYIFLKKIILILKHLRKMPHIWHCSPGKFYIVDCQAYAVSMRWNRWKYFWINWADDEIYFQNENIAESDIMQVSASHSL